MKRIGVVGLRPSIEEYHKIQSTALYNMVGRNTGNLLFTQAVMKHIQGDVERIGFSFDPEKVSKEFDALILPAANWLGEYVDMGFLADKLSKVNIPCIIVGLGAQAELSNSMPKLPSGTIRLLSILTDKSNSLSIRGHFTAEVLEHYGYKSFTITGCPSIFLNLQKQINIPEEKVQTLDKIIISSTRYHLKEMSNNNMADRINLLLFRTAYNLRKTMIYQSEIPEFQLLVGDEEYLKNNDLDGKTGDLLKMTYNAKSALEVIGYIKKHGKIFFDPTRWIEFIRGHDFVISSRIHGTIAALLADVPAVLLAHDSRTRELAEFCGIPVFYWQSPKTVMEYEDLEHLYHKIDVKYFKNRTQENYRTLKHFYQKNGIPSKL